MSIIPYVVFAILDAVAIALFSSWAIKKKQLTSVLLIALVIIVSLAIAYMAFPDTLGFGVLWTILLVGTAASAAILPMLYRSKPMWFTMILFLAIYAVAISYNRAAVVGMFGIGTIAGMLYNEHYINRSRENRSMRRTAIELKRDIVQMGMGIVVLCVMIISYSFGAPQEYIYILFGIMAIGYLFNNLLSSRGKVFHVLSDFERKDVGFGNGAIHLLAGLSILLGFAGFKLALFGIFPLFFADALATLTGITLYRSNKLFYNRRKSVAGTLAFLVATAVPGVLILGLWGFPIAAILTLIESVDLPIDDNVAVPIATILLGTLLGF